MIDYRFSVKVQWLRSYIRLNQWKELHLFTKETQIYCLIILGFQFGRKQNSNTQFSRGSGGETELIHRLTAIQYCHQKIPTGTPFFAVKTRGFQIAVQWD